MTGFSEQYGPWAVITGASEGTGAAFARLVAARGVSCILIARRPAPLETLAAELRRDFGVDCLVHATDLSDPDAGERIETVVGDREIGLFIANAGADLNGSTFLESEIDNWSRLVTLNVGTTMKLCHRFGRSMRARRRGGIILLGSGVSYGGMGSLAVYSGAKAFLLAFGESLWSELRDDEVHVLNLMMTRTDTPALRGALETRGLAVPAGLADAAQVAEWGLAQLASGPVANWGLGGDDIGFAPTSANARRDRIAVLETAGRAVMK
jgi:short-subunit dehydrogenase